MSGVLRELSPKAFTEAGRRLMGALWEEGQEAYEAYWLGTGSPQRAKGEILLLGWERSGRAGGARAGEDGGGDIEARLGLWKPAEGDPTFLLYARDPSLTETEAASFVQAARAFARERGMSRLMGPLQFSTWHPYRFVSRMGTAPFFPGEQRLAEQDARDFLAAGFRVIAEYQTTWVEDLAASLRTGQAMGVDRALGAVQVEILGKDRLPEVLPELHRLSCAIFQGNFGYTPLELRDFLALSSGGQAGESALVMASAGGRTAGFAYSYAIGPWAPGPDSPAVEACVLKTLGVHPDFRSLGLGYGLSYLTHKHWLEQGRAGILHAYMKTDNRSRSMSSHFGSAVRDYALLGEAA